MAARWTSTPSRGGPFDTFHLYGLRFRQPGPGTDLRIDHAELTLAWTLPGLQHPAPSWVRQLTLDGVRGRWDLAAGGKRRASPTLTGRFGWNDALAPRLIPAKFPAPRRRRHPGARTVFPARAGDVSLRQR